MAKGEIGSWREAAVPHGEPSPGLCDDQGAGVGWEAGRRSRREGTYAPSQLIPIFV